MDDSKTNDPMIAALLRERASYVNRGMADRAKAVDVELKRRGWSEPKAEKAAAVDKAADKAADGAPQGRRAPSKATTAPKVKEA